MVRVREMRSVKTSGCTVRVGGVKVAWYTPGCRFVGATKYWKLLDKKCHRCPPIWR